MGSWYTCQAMYWIVGGSNLLNDENTDEPRNFHSLFNDLTRLQAAESFTEAQEMFLSSKLSRPALGPPNTRVLSRR
jgi:hypothetical protein